MPLIPAKQPHSASLAAEMVQFRSRAWPVNACPQQVRHPTPDIRHPNEAWPQVPARTPHASCPLAWVERPSIARIQEYVLGSGYHTAADRGTAQRILEVAPEIAVAARDNRGFLRRAVTHALQHRVRQFLDLGSGIPSVGSVYQLTGELAESCRMVGVDHDPAVIAHTRSVLDRADNVGVVEADLHDPISILEHSETRRLIDFTKPVAIVCSAVLHFVPGDISGLVRLLRQAMAPGSYLIVSHVASVVSSAQTETVRYLLASAGIPLHPRDPFEIRRLFQGLDLIDPRPGSGQPPDLVPAADWRAEPDQDRGHLPSTVTASPFVTGLLAGVGAYHPRDQGRPTNPD